MDERYNIGILVNNGDERYIGGIVDGMRSVLAPKGHNLFVLSGTLQQYDIAQDAHLDYAFMTAAALDLDVYIVPVGMFNAHRKDDDTKSQGFLYRLPKEKVIVIEETVPSQAIAASGRRTRPASTWSWSTWSSTTTTGASA